MMTGKTKRTVDGAIDELTHNGYMVLIVLFDQKTDETKPMGTGVEVLCSETNDPRLLGAMLKTTLDALSNPVEIQRAN